MRTQRWSNPTNPSCTRTATACSARCRTPRTRCRSAAPRLARPRRVRGPQLAPLVALPDRDERVPRLDRAAPERMLPIDYGPPPIRTGAPGSRCVESVWIEPYPDERSASRTGTPRRTPATSGARRRARLHRRAAASARQPAGRPDPARGARLLGPGDRRNARHDGRLGEQRAATRPRRSRSALPEQSQQATCGRSATSGLGGSSSDYVDASRRGDIDAVVAMLTEDAVRHAAAGHLVPRPRR